MPPEIIKFAGLSFVGSTFHRRFVNIRIGNEFDILFKISRIRKLRQYQQRHNAKGQPKKSRALRSKFTTTVWSMVTCIIYVDIIRSRQNSGYGLYKYCAYGSKIRLYRWRKSTSSLAEGYTVDYRGRVPKQDLAGVRETPTSMVGWCRSRVKFKELEDHHHESG